LVEVIPGKHSGDPLVVGTRIPADLVLDLVESGYSLKEILEDYPSLTAEKLPKQHNLKVKALAIVVLSTLDWEIMKPNFYKVVAAVDAAVPGSLQAVECGDFRRG
jgi:hypothetical protein